MLLVKKLHDDAKLPTVANPGEDLAFDLYALEDVIIWPNAGEPVKVRTGLSACFIDDDIEYSTWLGGSGPRVTKERIFGLVFKDRSSMAAKGITVSGGVIDAGYRGELVVMLSKPGNSTYKILAGDKIIQMIPVQVETKGEIKVVDVLPDSNRQERGFGSTGQ
jgi:dUTP pyrophosphatase